MLVFALAGAGIGTAEKYQLILSVVLLILASMVLCFTAIKAPELSPILFTIIPESNHACVIIRSAVARSSVEPSP